MNSKASLVKEKPANGNTNKSSLPKKRGYYDDYLTLDTSERQPLTEESIDRWAKDLIDWGFNPANEARFISTWRRSKKISMHDWERLRAKYPRLQQAQEEVMLFIGENKLAKAEDNKGNWSAIRHTLYNHGKMFTEAEKFHADLKKEIEDNKVQLALMMINHTSEGDQYRKQLESKKEKAIEVE